MTSQPNDEGPNSELAALWGIPALTVVTALVVYHNHAEFLVGPVVALGVFAFVVTLITRLVLNRLDTIAEEARNISAAIREGAGE